MTRIAFAAVAGCAWLLAAEQGARAQEVDIEVPALILEPGPVTQERDEDIDLANVVQSAAKGTTTVQEAPAIVTVLTEDELTSLGLDSVEDMVDVVPGFLRHDALHNLFPFALVRGTIQSILYMHNGVSLYDPFNNTPQMNRTMPVEIIKRVETVTGPGGVLWGANSFLGIVNVITKDAEDVDGIEASLAYGDGPGDRGVVKGYVMAGIPDVAGDDTSLFLHSSFLTYDGPAFQMPQQVFSVPFPQPNSQVVFSGLTTADPARSYVVTIDGKLTLKDVSINFFVPFAKYYSPLGFPGVVSQRTLPEDALAECSAVPADDPANPGSRNPAAFAPDDQCVDRARLGRGHRMDYIDRYVSAEHRRRFADDKAGATVKAYAVQYLRSFQNLFLIAPSPLLEGGLGFRFDANSYRAGASYDGDVELPGRIRLLYGGELFHEWHDNTVENARQGDGIESTVVGPADLSRLALACPREPDPMRVGESRAIANCPLTFMFEADRTVIGGYVNPQIRLGRRLILDGGARVQVAPEVVSIASYPAESLLSATAVYRFFDAWHLKLSYAQGFRPPVFNNRNSNEDSIQIAGDPNLKVERSEAGQVELNARLFKGERRIRELNFRADYSYTRIENLIQIVGAAYENSGDRGIHSGELLGKLYVDGGHLIQLSYTWLQIDTTDKGRLRAIPEHWFHLAGVFSVTPSVAVTAHLRVLGAMEDPNRLVEYRPLGIDHLVDVNGDGLMDMVSRGDTIAVQPHELVLDRIPPSADLRLGVTYTGIPDLELRVFAYNAFNSRHYNPDAFHNYEPRLEFLPNPYPDARLVARATYRY